MPVDDHPVHASTKIDVDTYRHGCYNHTPADGYFVLVRVPDEHAVQMKGASNQPYILRSEWIPHRTTRDCAHARTGAAQADPACGGDCKWLTLRID